jgi:CubicO group peptidase (beta-lactamase class C family)
MAALHLVEQGKLSLDANVSQALTSWKNSPERGGAGRRTNRTNDSLRANAYCAAVPTTSSR